MNNRDIALLKKTDSEVILLSHSAAVLGWDQETYMPPSSVDERSRQLSLLSALVHERMTSETVKAVFSGIREFDEMEFAQEVSALDRAFARKFFDLYRKQSLLPASLVTELSRQASLTQHLWAKAREQNNFSLFSPELEKMVSLVRQKGECFGYEETLYDALLDEYEKGIKSSDLEKVFGKVEKRVKALLEKVLSAKQIDDSFLHGSFDPARQDQLGRKMLELLGYDLSRGRMDISAHPFTTTLGFSDVRITTHFKEDYFPAGLYSIIHECGHALYETGFGETLKDTCLAEGTSLGVHESQSRFWENIVGRGKGFSKLFWPLFSKAFPEAAGSRSFHDFFRAVNRVFPSLIRINADEVTYNLHIIMRYRLEKALVEGNIHVTDLPDAWNSMSEKLLGLKPDSNASGVLQDIHWSFGAIGYFPTYLLGNLYGAQFVSVMERKTGPVDDLAGSGNFRAILEWLRENIHRHGSVYTPDELIRLVTGEPLDPGFFLDYLDKKYAEVYRL